VLTPLTQACPLPSTPNEFGYKLAPHAGSRQIGMAVIKDSHFWINPVGSVTTNIFSSHFTFGLHGSLSMTGSMQPIL